jgi:thioredoxin reductase
MSDQVEPTAVIGAGPHGLATAAYLRAAGVPTICFGEPLEFWRQHMPAGMILRSNKRSTHIADPAGRLTIDEYARSERRPVHEPLLIEEFIDYGLWYQRHAVPDLDQRKVTALELDGPGFSLVLGDGTRTSASRVVVAAGLVPFARIPRVFVDLGRNVVSHTFDHHDLATFAGKRLLVVGAGQSALESAALASEAGAEVELVARAEHIHWLWGDGSEEESPVPPPGPSTPPTDVGAGLGGWIAAAPDVFRRLPMRLQLRLAYNCIRPAGSGWLPPRLKRVTMTLKRRVVETSTTNGTVRVRLDDGTARTVDHVLLGTGYALDVTRYPFMTPTVLSRLKHQDGYPTLGPGLESSVPRLHFVGAAAAHSFGPVMRFVVGTHYDAPAVAQRASGRRQPPIRFACRLRDVRSASAAARAGSA